MLRACAFILAGLAAATLDWSAPGQAQPPAAAQQKPGRITIRSVGQGTPIVLIPGLASPPAVWDDLAEKIGTRHRLIFVQVKGFGGSKPGMDPQDGLLPGAVDELAGWLAANHIAKPAVIGHSMGGLLGMMLAKAHPAAVGKLMIVDSLPFFGMLMGPGATPETVRPMAEQMRASLLKAPASSEPPPHMSNTDAGRAKVAAWMRASDSKVVGEALVEDATTDVRPDLPALATIPVTVLYAVPSAERRPMSEAMYREAYKALPQAKLVPVEGSEHFIMLDQPERFDEAVEAFLR